MEDLDRLIRCDSDDLPDNLLGVAIRIKRPERNSPHSGIFIRYNRQNYIFHFTGEGQKVFLSEPIENDWFFFKALNEVKFFIPSVFAHFRRIRSLSKPDYFYFYGGAMFDNDGKYEDPNGMPNYMTCVGFCLSVLKNSLRGTDFIKFKEWPDGAIEGKPDSYVQDFYDKRIAPNYQDITFEQFSKGVRRITPLEYVTAGFSGVIPVPKAFVDAHRSLVKEEIKETLNNWVDK